MRTSATILGKFCSALGVPGEKLAATLGGRVIQAEADVRSGGLKVSTADHPFRKAVLTIAQERTSHAALSDLLFEEIWLDKKRM